MTPNVMFSCMLQTAKTLNSAVRALMKRVRRENLMAKIRLTVTKAIEV